MPLKPENCAHSEIGLRPIRGKDGKLGPDRWECLYCAQEFHPADDETPASEETPPADDETPASETQESESDLTGDNPSQNDSAGVPPNSSSPGAYQKIESPLSPPPASEAPLRRVTF